MVLLSSRLMFVYDQAPILQVKSQTAILYPHLYKLTLPIT